MNSVSVFGNESGAQTGVFPYFTFSYIEFQFGYFRETKSYWRRDCEDQNEGGLLVFV